MNRKLRETLELIEQFPEAAKPHPDYNHSDIRMAVVGEYRMSYIILADEFPLFMGNPTRLMTKAAFRTGQACDAQGRKSLFTYADRH